MFHREISSLMSKHFRLVTEKSCACKIFNISRQEVSPAGTKCSEALPSFVSSSIYSFWHSNEVRKEFRRLSWNLLDFNPRHSLSSELINITPKSEEEWPFLLHAQFTPRGHSLVMVYNYDIYYKTGPKSAQSYRITKTALPSIIYNGVPDWLYEG